MKKYIVKERVKINQQLQCSEKKGEVEYLRRIDRLCSLKAGGRPMKARRDVARERTASLNGQAMIMSTQMTHVSVASKPNPLSYKI